MGRERKGCRYCVENRMLESLKMNLRILYSILIWYEFWFWPKELDMPIAVLTTKQNTLNKVPFWAASIILYFVEITEVFCAGGRQLTMIPAWYCLGIYIALYS
jgi:hypothetical protein